MSLPRISIVTPSYNQAQYIKWTVRSVLLQRYANLEYIVMDGGSNDGTLEVLKPYESRFAHFTSAKDKGQSDAISRGFERSTGDILAYLNSDDMLAPGALHFVADFFNKNPSVDLIYSNRVTVNAQNKVQWYWLLQKHSNYRMMRWDLMPQETCFWRRRTFEKFGNIDPTYRFAMDYDLFVRYMTGGAKFHHVNRFLGAFRVHDQAKTSQLMGTIGVEEIQRVWRQYKIRSWWWDRYVQHRHMHLAMYHGGRYVNQGLQLPGALRGLEYDYDEVWGGLLNDPRLPSAEPPVSAPENVKGVLVQNPQPEIAAQELNR